MKFSVASVAAFVTLAAAQSKSKRTVYETITSCTGPCALVTGAPFGAFGNTTDTAEAVSNSTVVVVTSTVSNKTASFVNTTVASSSSAKVSSTGLGNVTIATATGTGTGVPVIAVPTGSGSATAEKANGGSSLNTYGAAILGAAAIAALL